MPVEEKERAELRQVFARLQALGIEVPDTAEPRLLAYAGLIRAGAATTQLISRNDLDYIVRRHFRECLAVPSAYPFAGVNGLLDLGSGAGLPGIPLAIFLPSLMVTLLESKRKRVRFLQHVKDALALENVAIVAGRAEEIQGSEMLADVVIARAVAPLQKLWRWGKGFLPGQGRLLAMKGGDMAEERVRMARKYPSVRVTCFEYDYQLVPPELHRYLVVVRETK